ncbi:MAG: hypothetical protein V3W41_02190 [Planctomycetota bacterium]
MADELKKHVAANPPSEFKPHFYFDSDDDALTCHATADDYFTCRVDDFLTYFLSFDRRELVGFEFKGFTRMVERVGQFSAHFRIKPIGSEKMSMKEVLMGYYLLPDRATGEKTAPIEGFVTKDLDFTLEPAAN